MTRKRGTAFRAALIASLAVAFGVGSSALATTPPSEPAGGGGGECPRDIAAAAAAATTVPETTAAPATTAAAAAPATTAAAAPATTAAAPETTPPPTLAGERQPSSTPRRPATSIRSRGQPAAGWHVALVRRLAGRELEPQPSRRQRARLLRRCAQPMGYFPWLIDAEGDRHAEPGLRVERSRRPRTG